MSLVEFPDKCIKGILNNTYCLDESRVRAHLFDFKEGEDPRADRWIEQSINWEDDENAIDFTFNQKKEDGSTLFQAGVALIPTSGLRWLKGVHALQGETFGFERDPSDDNGYHGNLLIAKDTSRAIKEMLRSGLALCAERITPLGDNE